MNIPGRTAYSMCAAGIALVCSATAQAQNGPAPGVPAGEPIPGATTEELLIDSEEDDFVTDQPLVQETDAVDAIIVAARRREESVTDGPPFSWTRV
jgi:hypothetical protein